MKANTAAIHRLGPDQFLRFEHARGLCLRAESGALWVTVDGKTDDIALEAGSCLFIEGDAAVLVGAFRDGALVSASLPRSLPAWRKWFHSASPGTVAVA